MHCCIVATISTTALFLVKSRPNKMNFAAGGCLQSNKSNGTLHSIYQNFPCLSTTYLKVDRTRLRPIFAHIQPRHSIHKTFPTTTAADRSIPRRLSRNLVYIIRIPTRRIRHGKPTRRKTIVIIVVRSPIIASTAPSTIRIHGPIPRSLPRNLIGIIHIPARLIHHAEPIGK